MSQPAATGAPPRSAPWRVGAAGDAALPLLRSDALLAHAADGLIHGFTTRHGGVSAAPYGTLNLGPRCGDDPDAVAENRRRVVSALGPRHAALVTAEQTHGGGVAVVGEAEVDGGLPVPGVDALVTAREGVILLLCFADCYPVYLYDPARRVAAIAHSGWRGTAAGIAPRTVAVMAERYGCEARDLVAAIGPGISGEQYTVSRDVAQCFGPWSSDPGDPNAVVVAPPDQGAGVNLHLRRAVAAQLAAAGVRPEAVSVYPGDTYGEPERFFSHRRGHPTGRMAGFIGLQNV